MRNETVEIYSDQSNFAIMRHPGRNFPGSLIQGDSLTSLCHAADAVRREIDRGDLEEAKAELEMLRELLWFRLQHYETVLVEHECELPFSRGLQPEPPLEVFDDEDE